MIDALAPNKWVGIISLAPARDVKKYLVPHQVYFTVYVTFFVPSAGTSTGMWIVR